ncbi:MAG: hypothetical protein O3A00_03925 [Planctomycetota bacterium]|nr:hypothetical protein [Planctomycetota bacterium]
MKLIFAFVLVVTLVWMPGRVDSADEDRGFAVAPKGSDVLEHTFEGTFFVRRGLKQQFERLLAEVAALEGRVRNGELESDVAAEELGQLRDELKKVQRLVNDQKVLVSAFQIHRQVEQGTFELGPEQLLVLTSDKVKIVGWDQPHVKYELERIVLAGKDATKESVKRHLDGILIKHAHEAVPQFVGNTPAEQKADNEKFLAGPDGKKLTAKQRERRKKLVQHIADGYKEFAEFQGRKVRSLTLAGMIHQEGNRQIHYEIQRPEGGGSQGSRWRRHAKLTLYVPKCRAVLVRGCQQGVDISGLESHLIMTASGSRDRDYNGTFRVRNHRGPLTLLNVPIDSIQDVGGNVSVEATTEMVNTGNHHAGGFRTAFTPAARECSITNIRGNLTASFVRSNLTLRNIAGIVNVQNEFGDTQYSIAAPIQVAAHRVVSLAGGVRLNLSPGLKLGVPLFAATNCGTARTNLDRQELDDLSVTHSGEHDSVRRNWRSFHTPIPQGDFMAQFHLMSRPEQILFDQKRSPGLDLMSRGGRVEIVRQSEAK